MPFGLTISILLHLSVLAWALINLHTTPPLKASEPEPVEVALISPDDLVRLRQGSRDAKQLEAQPNVNQARQPPKEQPKTRMQAAAPPPPAAPPPEPEKTAPPEPPKPLEPAKPQDPIAEKIASLPPEPEGPSPEQIKQREEEEKAEQERKRQEEEARKAEEAKKAEERRRAEEKKKAEEARKKKLAEEKRKAEEAKKKQFDADRIAALLNKVPDKSAPPAGSPMPPSTPTKAKGPVAGAPEGHDSRLTASQRSLLGVMMKRAVSRCWNINSGLEGIDKVVVEVEVRLTPEGRLQQLPRVINSGGGPHFSDAADSAIRALVQCEPYDLPAEFYQGGWDHMVVTFDPQRMF